MAATPESYLAKYKAGKWVWDDKLKQFCFHAYSENPHTRYIWTNNHRFLRALHDNEEVIFRLEYSRQPPSVDHAFIMIADIRDLVFFLMPSEFLKMDLMEFMHTSTVRRLHHSLIMYFEYFMRVVEFMKIRRDEMAGSQPQIQSTQSNNMKRAFAEYLVHYRLIVARNYAKILLGEGELAKFHHIKGDNVSDTRNDGFLHDRFVSITIQIVWIAMHRRGYYIIEQEMLRLVGSDHFIDKHPEYLRLTPAESHLLYGPNYRLKAFRYQESPLIQELKGIRKEDEQVLWIGERKYRGTNKRIASLEIEYITPGPELYMVDIVHGILGHPKSLYTSMLEMDWTAVRFAKFTLDNDPFHIVRRPLLEIPTIAEEKMRKVAKNYRHWFEVYRVYDLVPKKMLQKWLCREEIKETYKMDSRLRATVRGQMEIESTIPPAARETYINYAKLVAKLREKGNTDLPDLVHNQK